MLTAVYFLDSGGSSTARRVIESAMKEWSDKTCIKFVRRTNQAGYAEFFKGGG